MSFDISTWYEQTAKDTLAAYKGEMSKEEISKLLITVEDKLYEINENNKIIKKTYNIVVEALQNLYHHATKNKNYAGTVFTLKNIGEGLYQVTTGNFIKVADIKLLKNRIDQINYLSKNEKKVLFKLILNNNEFSKKGGGGLGLIHISRKTEEKLTYKFYELNKEYFFFQLNIVIS